MLPSNLFDTVAFQQAIGINTEQWMRAAFSGLLPAASGYVNGSPVWAEGDVRSFASRFGYNFDGLSVQVTAQAHVMAPAATAPRVEVEVPNGYAERLEAGVAADPGIEVGATTHGKDVLTDAYGSVPITNPALSEALVNVLRKINIPGATAKDIGPTLRPYVPENLITASPTINGKLRADEYSTAELCAYLGVNDKFLERVVASEGIRLKRVPGSRNLLWSDAKAQRIRKSETYKNYRVRLLTQPEGLAAFRAWLMDFANPATVVTPVRRHAAEKPAAHDANAPDPNTWLTEPAAADHLGLPLEVLQIVRKERTGPLATYKDGKVMYRVGDLEVWRAANMTKLDDMRHSKDRKLNEAEAAQVCGLTIPSMRKMRKPGKHAIPGPAFHTGPRNAVWFWESDLHQWMKVHAAALEKKRALINSPEVQARVQNARARLAEVRAQAGMKVGGRGNTKAKAAAAAAPMPQTPTPLALNKSLTNGKATMADKLEAHAKQAGKVGKKSVVKRTLSGAVVRH